MTGDVVRDAYAGRAEEYTALLGSMANTHESDQRLVAQWARDLRGAVIDAGCGPGHWTDFLKKRGVDAEGIDHVQAFIVQARKRFPTVPSRVASLDDLEAPDGYAAAILAWYSVIHLAPNDLPAVLREFARCIAPGSSLLLGFFEGDAVVPFPHAVTTAYFWPIGEMSTQLEAAGFHVHAVTTRIDGSVPSEVPCQLQAPTPIRPRNLKGLPLDSLCHKPSPIRGA
ncbi:bifunctional 2-polyprenyl-6-hydroxyphenol methylase/3-demethylubiquinol 3-O-methyltransferase UbiG [Cryobacterium sp. Y11]|uniref:class I SAM-dependent methyltransferase n=1 Tax=Cryobacterium sp. Y11 TaxID=2045016 RepID=UPI000CE2F397|nr:class I SAM-dependent methyltransferase [Cryobacterium sp. Y11]